MKRPSGVVDHPEETVRTLHDFMEVPFGESEMKLLKNHTVADGQIEALQYYSTLRYFMIKASTLWYGSQPIFALIISELRTSDTTRGRTN